MILATMVSRIRLWLARRFMLTSFVSAAVKTQRDRRDIFDEFCKDKIRERRAAKAKLAQSGIKVDVSHSPHLCG